MLMRSLAIISLILFPLFADAQVVFKTVVPQQPVVAGESFQVQYIIEEAEDVANFMAPVFPHFRLVTGPNIYHGNTVTLGRSRTLRNTVYTLEATKTGKFRIPGAAATVNGELVKSPDQQIVVISQAEAMQRFDREHGTNGEYFLRPGEDPYAKINKNLFMKVMVDRKSCYTGQPVVATFKLYSRLESKSDIVKNPGFYGFTVHDVVNLQDHYVTTENVDGRPFDVHTIRKVELFPLQAGTYTIDPMEIKNTVEFSKSAVYRKTEQEIVEGVNIESSRANAENTVTYETEMRTEPVTIEVKPLPVAGKPAGYDGAVGSLSIRVSLSSGSLAKNQEGILELQLSGAGNLIQVSAPKIKWPEHVEGFEPLVVSHTDEPGAGAKTFRYAFVSSKPGSYNIPSIEFSFFNPDSGKFKTVKTGALAFRVSNEELNSMPESVKAVKREKQKPGWLIPVIIALLVSGLLSFLFILRTRKRKPVSAPMPTPLTPAEQAALWLLPAQKLIGESDREFYQALRQGMFNYFSDAEGMRGSELGKEHILSALRRKAVSEEIVQELASILETCETGIYTSALLHVDKELIMERAKYLLVKLCEKSL